MLVELIEGNQRFVEEIGEAPMRGRTTQKPDKAHRETEEQEESLHDQESIDETIEESFPASDPPSWTSGRRGNRG